MNRLSVRMILFIVALSALHISGIAPRKPPAIRAPLEAASGPAAQGRITLSSPQAARLLQVN